ncbi:MAG: hypothetical protein HY567_00805 [Candidatus Kerfeldbacteria bacterium]|nr:hypothetical protein [Candidatus Kerfeldbacteria bacterium]
MVEASIKPNGSGIQFDNFLDKILRDDDHRGVAHCLVRVNRGKEGDEVKSLIERRALRRKGGLRVGTRVLGTEELLDRWCEVTVEVWIKILTVRKPLEQITPRDLRPAVEEYRATQQASLTIESNRIFDGVPDPQAIAVRLKEVLSAAGHSGVDVKTRRIHWSPGLQLVTIRLQPASAPQLEMGDDYPIPSPPK